PVPDESARRTARRPRHRRAGRRPQLRRRVAVGRAPHAERLRRTRGDPLQEPALPAGAGADLGDRAGPPYSPQQRRLLLALPDQASRGVRPPVRDAPGPDRRSEERRVGKEGSNGWREEQGKKIAETCGIY